jgi:hypothetical protein
LTAQAQQMELSACPEEQLAGRRKSRGREISL